MAGLTLAQMLAAWWLLWGASILWRCRRAFVAGEEANVSAKGWLLLGVLLAVVVLL